MNSSPNLTGMAVKDVATAVDQSEPDYTLDLDIVEELRSLKLSGEIIGAGNTKVILKYDSGELIVINKQTESDIILEKVCEETCDINITSKKYTLLFYLEKTKLNLQKITYLFPKSETETLESEIKTQTIQITE